MFSFRVVRPTSRTGMGCAGLVLLTDQAVSVQLPGVEQSTVGRMPTWSHTERTDIAQTLRAVGPQAPTLCQDWNALRLLSHLVLRENRVDALVGMVLPFAAGYTERLQRQLEQRYGFDGLVQRFADGPPRWSPLRIAAVDEAVNVIEHFTHHEDLRRAQPGWVARELPPGYQAALWNRLRRLAKVLTRRAAPLRLVAPGYGDLVITSKTAPGAAPMETVTVTAPPSELVLFCYGRQTHSTAQLLGAADRITQLRSAKLGF
ncbi:MAG: TIGR03085 family metal-binding protein [Mycobacteriales bacterium]